MFPKYFPKPVKYKNTIHYFNNYSDITVFQSWHFDSIKDYSSLHGIQIKGLKKKKYGISALLYNYSKVSPSGYLISLLVS